MKQQFISIRNFFALWAFIFTMASCQKEAAIQPPPSAKGWLTARTWLIEEVNDHHDLQPRQLYKKGAANNEDDYSAVRQTFRNDGSVVYVDQFGDQANNGTFELLDNDTKIRLGMSGPQSFSIIAENFSINPNRFSYRLNDAAGYIEFVFVPVQ